MSTCDEMRELLPEYAAGALDGRELATVEAHLKTCALCRAEAEELLAVVDQVIQLAPSTEPRVGFEAAVMSRIDGVRRRRRVVRPLLVAAAAAILLVTGIGIGRIVTTTEKNPLQAFALQSAFSDRQVGKVWVHDGAPGWIYIDMEYNRPYPSVRVEVETDDGAVLPVGQLSLEQGHGTLGLRSPVPVDTVRVVRMRNADGALLCHGELSA